MNISHFIVVTSTILIITGCSQSRKITYSSSSSAPEPGFMDPATVPLSDDNNNIFVIPDLNVAVKYSSDFSFAGKNIQEEVSLIYKPQKGNSDDTYNFNIRYPAYGTKHMFDLRLANDLTQVMSGLTPTDGMYRLCKLLENPAHYLNAIVTSCSELASTVPGVEFLYAEKSTKEEYLIRWIAIRRTQHSSRPAIMIDTPLNDLHIPVTDEADIVRTKLQELHFETLQTDNLRLSLFHDIIDSMEKVRMPELACGGTGRCGVNMDPEALFVTRLLGNDPGKVPTKDPAFLIEGTANQKVKAIEIYSSCDKATYRLKNFKPSSGHWEYRVDAKLGNLCSGPNEFIIRAFSSSGTMLTPFLIDEEPIHITSEISTEAPSAPVPSWF